MTRYFTPMVPIGLLLMVMIGGCQNKTSSQPGNSAVLSKSQTWSVPMQVVYQIDSHRFVSLEDYDRCLGDAYYNDTQQHIHIKIFTHDPTNYRGRLIIDDPAGMNIVIPANVGCCGGDWGCSTTAAYSTDGGRSFKWMSYRDNRNNLSKDSEGDTIAVTKDRFYVKERWGTNDAYVSEYPLIPRIDLEKPYPAGVRGSSFAESDRPHFLMVFTRHRATIVSPATSRFAPPIFPKKNYEKLKALSLSAGFVFILVIVSSAVEVYP